MIFTSLLILFVNVLMSVFLVFYIYSKTKKIKSTIYSFLLLILEIFFMSYLVMINYRFIIPDINTVFFVIISLLFTPINIFLIYINRSKYSTIISNNSIKESIEKIPLGLCYYYSNGMPILVNKLMNNLSVELTGTIVQNGNTFSEMVDKKTVLYNDRYYTFSKKYININNNKVIELSANDVTKQHLLCIKLDDENKKIKELNNQLYDYSNNVEQLTYNKEVLKAKMDIHHQMGTMLLETKVFLENDKKDYKPLISNWHNTINMFKSNLKNKENNDSVEHLIDIAKSMNLKVIINGKIGENTILFDALKECITNAIRHGNATELIVTVNDNVVEFTNNGTVPQQCIVEGGGLSNLREKVESMGGKMKVQSYPKFTLTIRL